MFFINDTYYDRKYVNDCFSQFDSFNLLRECRGKTFTVCIKHTPILIPLFLYIKKMGGSIFPLESDTPYELARSRQVISHSNYLIFSRSKSIEGMMSDVHHAASCGDRLNGVLLQMKPGHNGKPRMIERSWKSIDIEDESYINSFSELKDMIPIIALPMSQACALVTGVLVSVARKVSPVIITKLLPEYIIRKLSYLNNPILYSSSTLLLAVSMMVK